MSTTRAQQMEKPKMWPFVLFFLLFLMIALVFAAYLGVSLISRITTGKANTSEAAVSASGIPSISLRDIETYESDVTITMEVYEVGRSGDIGSDLDFQFFVNGEAFASGETVLLGSDLPFSLTSRITERDMIDDVGELTTTQKVTFDETDHADQEFSHLVKVTEKGLFADGAYTTFEVVYHLSFNTIRASLVQNFSASTATPVGPFGPGSSGVPGQGQNSGGQTQTGGGQTQSGGGQTQTGGGQTQTGGGQTQTGGGQTQQGGGQSGPKYPKVPEFKIQWRLSDLITALACLIGLMFAFAILNTGKNKKKAWANRLTMEEAARSRFLDSMADIPCLNGRSIRDMAGVPSFISFVGGMPVDRHGAAYGSYTVYCTPGGKYYHRTKGCQNATKAIHNFRAQTAYTPCPKCQPKPREIPMWFERYQEMIARAHY